MKFFGRTDQTIGVKGIPRILKACPVDMNDAELELPKAYVDGRPYSDHEILEAMSSLYKENLAFKVRYGDQYVSSC
jgi:hypothetical protein